MISNSNFIIHYIEVERTQSAFEMYSESNSNRQIE